MSEHLSQTVRDHVLHLGLNRPEKKNAFDRDLYFALADAISGADRQPDIRVIHIGAEGNCFSAGNDIADFVQEPPSGSRTDPALALLDALNGCAKPIVASVNGRAIGIGATLLLHCDLIYLSESASLIFPFVSLGLCPEGGSSLVVPQRVGHVKAFEWLVLGQPCTAADAVHYGLANAVLPDDALEGAVAKVLSGLVSLDPDAVLKSKALLKTGIQAELKSRMREEIDIFEQLLEGEAAKATLNKFLSR